MEMFQYGFMQRAFCAGLLIAVIAPLLGVFLLVRRQVLMADTLSHISLAGVAMGTLLGFSPVAGAFIIALTGAAGMEWLRRLFRSYSEVSVAVTMTMGLAIAVVLMSMNNGLNQGFTAYLFGSIVAVHWTELGFILLVSILVLLFFMFMRRSLFSMAIDEDMAQVSGVPVRMVSMAFSLLSGMTVAVAMPILGVLLVSAMMVLPAALAVRIATGFMTAMITAVGIGITGMIGGLSFSYYMGTPPGGTIALILVLFLLTGLCIVRASKLIWKIRHYWRDRFSSMTTHLKKGS